MEQVFLVAAGMASVGIGWFGYLVAKKGYAWGAAKLKAWWNAGKADLASLKGDFAALESRVTTLEGVTKTLTTPPAAPPAG